MNKNPEANITVQKNGKLTFYITEHRIGLDTGFQFFSIQGANQYCTKQVQLVREMIVAGQITTILEFYDAAEKKVLLKNSQKSWFYDAVARLDPKPEEVVLTVIEEEPMAILLEPEPTEVAHLHTTLMAVKV